MDSRVIGGIGLGLQSPASFALPTVSGKTEFKAPIPQPQVQMPNIPAPSSEVAVDARLELIQRISVEKFSYPLGDSRFTIFKDARGQYIVKYTSMKDGSIRQIPEPELLTDYVSRGKGPIVFTSA